MGSVFAFIISTTVRRSKMPGRGDDIVTTAYSHARRVRRAMFGRSCESFESNGGHLSGTKRLFSFSRRRSTDRWQHRCQVLRSAL